MDHNSCAARLHQCQFKEKETINQMPFTQTPQYEDREKWPDFVGETVILEPIKKHERVPTKFGLQDCFEAIVWVLRDGGLEPHAGIRIFNNRIISQLDVALRMQAPIAGQVERDGNSVKVMPLEADMEQYLESLFFNNGNGVAG